MAVKVIGNQTTKGLVVSHKNSVCKHAILHFYLTVTASFMDSPFLLLTLSHVMELSANIHYR